MDRMLSWIWVLVFCCWLYNERKAVVPSFMGKGLIVGCLQLLMMVLVAVIQQQDGVFEKERCEVQSSSVVVVVVAFLDLYFSQ